MNRQARKRNCIAALFCSRLSGYGVLHRDAALAAAAGGGKNPYPALR
jgi:hypothetical protein